MVDLIDLSHIEASDGNAFALCDDEDASDWRWDAIPFFLLIMKVPGWL